MSWLEGLHHIWHKASNDSFGGITFQLQGRESPQSLRQQVKGGGAISEQERDALKSSIEEQETMIRGYQKVHTCTSTYMYT